MFFYFTWYYNECGDKSNDVSLTSTAFASSVSSSTFCDGEAITFTATSTSGISTYTFMVGGSSVYTGASNSYTPGAPFSSTVSVAVRVETTAGCTATDTLDLFYNDIDVTGTIGQASATVCENETPPAFTNDAAATATIGTISYRWETRTSGTAFVGVVPAVTTAVYTPTTRDWLQLPFLEGLLSVLMEEKNAKNIVI